MQTEPNLFGVHRSRWFFSEQLQRTRQSQAVAAATSTVSDFGSAFDVLHQQISGLLQRPRLSEPPRGLPSSDPYRTPVLSQRQASVVIPALSIEFGGQRVRPAEEIDVALESLLISALAAAPKVVASFVGRVEALVGDSASVLLINEETGECLESRCDAEVLRENGIGDGDEFRCVVHRSKGATATRLSRLPPKTLSKERVDQIRAAFKNRWTF